jgi:hypothetical protein
LALLLRIRKVPGYNLNPEIVYPEAFHGYPQSLQENRTPIMKALYVCYIFYRAIALMMETVSTSETSVSFYQTTWRNVPEDSHLYIRHRENLKSHLLAPASYARGYGFIILKTDYPH